MARDTASFAGVSKYTAQAVRLRTDRQQTQKTTDTVSDSKGRL